MPSWYDPNYLQRGTPQQQRAGRVLQALGVWQVLAAFDPVLTGKVPLAIGVAVSDLDVICTVPPAGQLAFAQLLRAYYQHLPGITLRQKFRGGGVGGGQLLLRRLTNRNFWLAPAHPAAKRLPAPRGRARHPASRRRGLAPGRAGSEAVGNENGACFCLPAKAARSRCLPGTIAARRPAPRNAGSPSGGYLFAG